MDWIQMARQRDIEDALTHLEVRLSSLRLPGRLCAHACRRIIERWQAVPPSPEVEETEWSPMPTPRREQN